MDSISFQNRQKTWKYIYVDHIINNYGYFHDYHLQTYRFEKMAYFTYKMYNDDVMYNGNNYIDDNDGWTRIMLVQKNVIIYI